MDWSKCGFAVVIAFALALALPADLLVAQTRPADCVQKCVRGVDTGYCSDSSGIGSGRNCQEVSECTVHAVDADGAGPGAPIITVTCTYSCSIEHCFWV